MSTEQEIEDLKLVARFVKHLLLGGSTIAPGTADACNIVELCYEGLGEHDNYPQVPLDDIRANMNGKIPPEVDVDMDVEL